MWVAKIGARNWAVFWGCGQEENIGPIPEKGV